MTEEEWKGTRGRLVLAASRGVLKALTTDGHLGDAARFYGYKSRTLEGDAFEEAFEWAKEERKALEDRA